MLCFAINSSFGCHKTSHVIFLFSYLDVCTFFCYTVSDMSFTAVANKILFTQSHEQNPILSHELCLLSIRHIFCKAPLLLAALHTHCGCVCVGVATGIALGAGVTGGNAGNGFGVTGRGLLTVVVVVVVGLSVVGLSVVG